MWCWSKMFWLGKEGSRHLLEIGLSLNEWAILFQLTAIKAYTTRDNPERWAKEVTVTFLCFYFSITW